MVVLGRGTTAPSVERGPDRVAERLPPRVGLSRSDPAGQHVWLHRDPRTPAAPHAGGALEASPARGRRGRTVDRSATPGTLDVVLEPVDSRAPSEQRPREPADPFPDRARGVSARREDFPVLTDLQTRWRDNDVYGHVNNVVYYEYFDTAVNAWLHEQVGRVAREGEAIGVVAETTCRYLHEVSFPQQIVVGLACERLGRTSITYRLAIFAADVAGAGPAALGRFVHVYVDRDSRRPVAVPERIRQAVQRVLVPRG